MLYREDERWPDFENIPVGARSTDQNVSLAQAVDDPHSSIGGRLAGCVVSYELDAQEQARRSHISDQAVL